MPPFHLHPLLLITLVVVGAAHVRAARERVRRQRAAAAWFVWGLAVLWPLGDLAATVSLSAATVQRLVIMLVVAPLLLASTSTSQLVHWTRAPAIDSVVHRLAQPAWAIVTVTLIGTLTLSVPVVDAGSTSPLVRWVTVVTVLGCGIILWIPALGVMPGARRLSPVGRAAYIFVSPLAVTSLSLVWIFARHPLYPGLQHQESLLHMSPLFDQQLAGFVAKLGSYLPMWTVAFVIFSRADDAGVGVDESPLHWADVERELLRVDRQRARARRRLTSRPDVVERPE